MSGPTPSQTVGPFFHYALTEDHAVADLASEATQGRHIVIEGRLFDADGAPVPDAMIEIWQANAAGRYEHPEDRQDKPLDPTFRGFGRCATDAGGGFRFRTIKPGPVPGRGNTLQAPHILVSLFARGLLKQLVTRIYFADEPLNESDPVLALVDDPERRRTLLARPQDTRYLFDIHLAGEDETVFFDV